MQLIRTLSVCLVTTAALFAQAAAGTVQATGNASLGVNPDQASISIGVVTQGITAQDAAQQNATLSTTVQAAIRGVLGANGTIQTTSYSVSPRYNNANPATIVGYTASNSVLVTTYDLSIIGKLIDTANGAGANNVGGVTFGLRNPDPFVAQALSQAAKQALTYAAAIAAGLNAHTGAVVSAQEGSTYTPVYAPGVAAGAAASTPIQTGAVTVTANVTVVVQMQ
ncbi:MAG TPA: SIMPL domain-containing protein [Bryobacteraceae bacterium]|nr:SIMPL domain-containing protein [Bryobacteraceae bacterium]